MKKIFKFPKIDVLMSIILGLCFLQAGCAESEAVRAAPSTYTISTNTPSNGTISCTPTSVDAGSNSTCTMTASSGYTLSALTDNGSDVLSQVTGGNTYVITNVTADHTVDATFALVTPTPLEDANLSVTPSTLTLSVTGLTTTTGNNSGTPRFFTVQNTGPGTARNVACPTSTSPSITSITCLGCNTILSGSSCTVTITPSATPSAEPGDTSPIPITLTIQGSNTNTLNPTVNVLTYGSFYQAGYLFSIIETANTSLSIGGTVAAESDNAAQNSTLYSLGGADTTSAMYSGTNGLANTGAMVAQYGAGTYSATVCTTSTGGGYADWYLPAICQMGFGGSDQNFNCGTSPGIIPNIQYNLLIRNNPQDFNFVTGPYWSSTASEDSAPTLAWLQLFAVGGNDGAQFLGTVVDTLGVRCVRDLQ